MRPIHTARLDKVRPVLVLTREIVRPHMSRVTVATITGTVRGLSTEVPVGPANGLAASGVVSAVAPATAPRSRSPSNAPATNAVTSHGTPSA